jgi:glc operon protein GlcG
MNTQGKTLIASIFAVVLVTAASAQQAPSPPPTMTYGPPIGLEAAKKVMTAAEAEAVKNNWAMAIAILDSTGHMVMLHRLDNTQYGSIGVAEDKARSALCVRGPGGAGRPRNADAGAAWSLAARRRHSHCDGRQDRRGDRRLGRHLGTGWPSRQGGRRRREVSAVRRS